MKRTQLLTLCLFTVATVFLNAACGPTTKVTLEPIETEVKQKPKTEYFVVSPTQRQQQPPSKNTFSCTHQVGSIVRQGESVYLTYKAVNTYINATFTVTSNNMTLNSDSNIQPTVFGIENGIKCCWDKNNCFIATNNGDGSWTIKSLPFVNKGVK